MTITNEGGLEIAGMYDDELEGEHLEAEELDGESGEGEDLTPNDAPEEDERDWEAEATIQGWKPDGGDKTAREFVEIGDKIAARQSKKIDTLQRESEKANADFADRLARMEAMNEKARQRDRERLEAQYAAKTREAVAIGDVDTFDQLQSERAESLKQFEPAPQQPQQQAIDPDFSKWAADNTWFNDPNQRGASQYALAEFQGLIDRNPGVREVDLLPQLNAKIAETFPALVGAKARQTPRQMTDRGGSRRSAPRSKGVADLPPEARTAGKDFVEDGIYADMNAYAKDYWAQG